MKLAYLYKTQKRVFRIFKTPNPLLFSLLSSFPIFLYLYHILPSPLHQISLIFLSLISLSLSLSFLSLSSLSPSNLSHISFSYTYMFDVSLSFSLILSHFFFSSPLLPLNISLRVFSPLKNSRTIDNSILQVNGNCL